MNQIEAKIIARCKEIRQELITAIQQIVQIPSIKSAPLEDAPYGKAIKQALDHTLSLAESFGFETQNIGNQVGFAHWGHNTEYIGIMGHLDVVDVEDGWLVPPFSGEIVEDKIISRGVLDNKGPIYTNLFALKVVKEICEEEDIQLPLAIRIIFGCDEESGFHDVPHYLANEQPPKYGYTPDCKYPPVYSEGIYGTRALKHYQPNGLYFLTQKDHAINLFIDKARCNQKMALDVLLPSELVSSVQDVQSFSDGKTIEWDAHHITIPDDEAQFPIYGCKIILNKK